MNRIAVLSDNIGRTREWLFGIYLKNANDIQPIRNSIREIRTANNHFIIVTCIEQARGSAFDDILPDPYSTIDSELVAFVKTRLRAR